MASDPMEMTRDDLPDGIEMPRPTTAPLVLALGMVLLAAGVATDATFLVVGAVILGIGLTLWIMQLVPSRGEYVEDFVADDQRPRPVDVRLGKVGRMQEGMPGSRFQIPGEMHPISAGVRGGIIGGLAMPVPAVVWSLLSGHGLWYPINLLAGLVLPGVDGMTVTELEQFRPLLLVSGIVMHVINSATFGLIYGVLMPMLPDLPRPLAWGGLAMPLGWTALTFLPMSVANPLLSKGVSWPWFIGSQFVFGVVAAAVIVAQSRHRSPPVAGLIGGIAGGLAMPVPALLWGLATRHGVWYPANLLAAVAIPRMDTMPLAALESFRPDWLAIAVLIHVAMSLGLGVILGLVVPKLPAIPSTLAWGGLLFPLLWTSVSYSLMGVVNPILQERVDWFWFIASQFVFGVVASVVIHHSERVAVAPTGHDSEPPGQSAEAAAKGNS